LTNEYKTWDIRPVQTTIPIPNPALSSGHSQPELAQSGLIALLDQLLRKREEFFEEIYSGRDVGRWARRFLIIVLLLSAGYGLTMGALGFSGDFSRGLFQSLSSAVKVPLLYLASLAVCYPVLYIVLVLMGVRLSFMQSLTLILLALTLNAILLASCAPIVLFFILTGSNYHFIKLLHVAAFAFSGAWAMQALWKGLQATCEKSNLYPRQAIKILQVWVLVFGFVGSQMAWSLRPYVGAPELGFQLFRPSQSGNFYQAVWYSLAELTGAPTTVGAPDTPGTKAPNRAAKPDGTR
jgi:hypothetical protein